jgi:hypothetical protein
MTKFRRWFSWVIWYVRDLRARWYRWCRGLVNVCSVIQIHSIRIDGSEQLNGSVPGTVFSEVAHRTCIRLPIPAGGEVALEVENLTQSRLPFRGMFQMRGAHEFRMELLPIPPLILEPKERCVIRLRAIRGGFIEGLMIPNSLPALKH